MSVHVWMLSDGGPTETDDIPEYLRTQLHDPCTSHVSGWFRFLWIWWLMWRWRPRLTVRYQALPGPSPTEQALAAQARMLTRHLGKGYVCQPVFRYQRPDVAQAAAAVGRGERVVLLPMMPHRCGAMNATVIAANTHLGERSANVTTVPSYPAYPKYIEALAETLRAGIADLPSAQHTTYEVLFTAVLPAESRRGSPDPEHHDEIAQTVSAVIATTGLVRPHHIGYTSPVHTIRHANLNTHQQLQDMAKRGVPAVVVVPVSVTSEQVNTLVTLDQQLRAEAESKDMTFVRAETVATRPTFVHALAALIREAEQDADWNQ